MHVCISEGVSCEVYATSVCGLEQLVYEAFKY